MSGSVIASSPAHHRNELSTGCYPHIEALFGESSALEVWKLIVEMSAESRFEKGLALLLDGIETRVGGA
jgi:hypothetical protein